VASENGSTWTFLTNHANVLIYVAEHPEVRGRDIADAVGITERAVQMIISDLEADGYLTRTRVGRRNRYRVHSALRMRHPLHRDHTIGDLIEAMRTVRREY
jgi:DNA-binding MarR family transcriptional regulator